MKYLNHSNIWSITINFIVKERLPVIYNLYTVDARVTEFIRKQIREGCQVSRDIIKLKHKILLEERLSMGRKSKKAKGKNLFILERKSET